MSLKVRDIVQLSKHDQSIIWIARAVVLQHPAGPGDVWGFRNMDSGLEVYTNETFTAYVLERAE